MVSFDLMALGCMKNRMVAKMRSYNSDLPKIQEFVQLGNKSLLEVGCGDGRLTSLLADKTQKITAVDPDTSSIESARTNIPGVDFQVGTGENLDFADNSFDIVLFSYSLHHQDCTKAQPEAQRVVRHNGQILILEPIHDSEFTRLVSIFEPQEPQLLLTTLDYILSGRFNIQRRETYGIDYPFADDHELYQYFIAKFSTAVDDRAVEKMQTVIGNKVDNRPIIIQDKVNIFLIANMNY
jgi:SAM-dependent methyltransferase